MRLGKKKYGWNIMAMENMGTIPTLYQTTVDFLKKWQQSHHPPFSYSSSFTLTEFDDGSFSPEPYFTLPDTPDVIFPRHMRPFINASSETYNGMHYWSNFEIGKKRSGSLSSYAI
jgi:hypothetical protein